MDNVTLIAAAEAQTAAEAETTARDKLLAAMRSARRNWICTDENQQFLAALEGAARSMEEPDKEKVIAEAEQLGKLGAVLNALTAGVPVDLEAMEKPEPIEGKFGLRDLWAETA